MNTQEIIRIWIGTINDCAKNQRKLYLETDENKDPDGDHVNLGAAEDAYFRYICASGSLSNYRTYVGEKVWESTLESMLGSYSEYIVKAAIAYEGKYICPIYARRERDRLLRLQDADNEIPI